MMHLNPHNEARWTLVIQGMGLVVLFPLAWIIKDFAVACSFLYGCATCLIPNFLFYRRVFRTIGAQSARKIVNAFYFGEALKLILTASLFVIGFHLKGLKPEYILIGFIAIQLLFWMGPITWGLQREVDNL